MKKILLGLLALGLTTQFMFSQIIELSEVRIAVNYKYLDAINSEEVAVPVKMLEEKVAFYNLKDSDLYSDEYDMYTINFFIPEGKIVAAYDKDGKILRTIEKFKDIKLPKDVLYSVAERFPNWTIEEDVYRVSYNEKSGNARKEYKIRLRNGDKTMVIKVNEKGEFL